MKIFKATALTFFVFGLAGWIYIALIAVFHPDTLSLGLTHFSPYPREDSFGIVCFAVSFMSFFIYNIIKDNK